MAVSLADLKSYIKNVDDDVLCQLALDAAVSLLAMSYPVDDIPDAVLDSATMQVASDLWERHNSTAGFLSGFSVEGGNPARLASDPLVSVRAILAPWRTDFGIA